MKQKNNNISLRNPVLWILAGICLWMLFTCVQALHMPLDGEVWVHLNEPGASLASGPFLASAAKRLVFPVITQESVRWGYALLLILVPLGFVWIIGTVRKSRQTDPVVLRRALTVAVLALAILTTFNLTYLSNDVYLYRLYGVMLSESGSNPYVVAPVDEFFKKELQNIPWVHQRCAYGPLALALFTTVCSLSDSIVTQFWMLKILMVIPWILLLFFVGFSRRYDPGEKNLWLAWIGLNPLLLIEVCQNSHIEGWLGFLLFLAVFTLSRVTLGRAALAALLFGLACAMKLSVVVALPVFLAWLMPVGGKERRSWGSTLLSVFLFTFVTVVVLVGLYLPLWEGAVTFSGLQRESLKVIRSFYSILIYQVKMPRTWIWIMSVLGNLAAALLGVAAVRWRGGLAGGLILCFLIQAVLGRTFLQPWYFCTLVVLTPALFLFPGRKPENEETERENANVWLPIHDFLLTVSVSAIAGAYAVPMILKGFDLRTTVWCLSFLCMIIPPLAVWTVSAGRRRFST